MATANFSNRQLYGRLFALIKPYGFRALIATLVTMPIGMLDGAIAFSIKPFVDSMQAAKAVAHSSYTVPFVILGFTAVQGILQFLSTYLNGWLGMRLLRDLRHQLYQKLHQLDVQYFDTVTSGQVIQSFFRDPEQLRSNVLDNLKNMITRFSSSVFLVGVLIHHSWQLSIWAVAILALILLPSLRIRTLLRHTNHRLAEISGNIMSFYVGLHGGARVVHSFNAQEHQQKALERLQRQWFDEAMALTKAQGWLTPSMHFIASLGIALMVWQGSAMILSKQLTPGAFVSFIVALLMLYDPMKNMGNSYVTLQQSLFAANRVFTLLDGEANVVDAPHAVAIPSFQDSIVLENVQFAYVPGKPVLKGISATLKKGAMVAIVGPSGSGKTTLINLLPRFYDVDAGRIVVDGHDVRDVTTASLRAQMALVLQDNFMFQGTLRENLMAGLPNATEVQCQKALKRAYLSEFIETLPEGLDTEVGERAVMLSGGQRQRLAIARAFLKNAPIVILDEATSALDSHSEAVVQQALEGLMADRTVIVIAHRLSTVKRADEILVMHEGLIVERGTHETLYSQQGLYTSLYNCQFEEVPVK